MGSARGSLVDVAVGIAGIKKDSIRLCTGVFFIVDGDEGSARR